MESSEAVLRVERGVASEEELAALAVVLLALWSHPPVEPEPPPALGWSWWDGSAGYAPPESWR
ncbi:acyl-CoA carboxylase epsilon subunit [Streptomyces sp. NPDC006458]|uniref:acyl-CoA carboxylase epsilon subunit n=1 Tax=Streptomyces sp. NPDC006458 TaxID=3154302 RepID=UPI0033A047D3